MHGACDRCGSGGGGGVSGGGGICWMCRQDELDAKKSPEERRQDKRRARQAREDSIKRKIKKLNEELQDVRKGKYDDY